MRRVQIRRIIKWVALLATLGFAALVLPFVVYSAREAARVAETRPADPATQRAIVRAFLRWRLANDQRRAKRDHALPERVHFDRAGAIMRDLKSKEPWGPYEIRAVRKNGRDDLVNPARLSIPVRVQELLDQIVRQPSTNIDPGLDGIEFTDTSSSGTWRLPQDCSAVPMEVLVRMSTAVIDQRRRVGAALVTTTYCYPEPGVRFVGFKQDKAGWHVIQDEYGPY